MLPVQFRLKKRGLFQRVYSRRLIIRNDHFTLQVLPRFKDKLSISQKPPNPLIGFVISKKIVKEACLRNKSKRKIREAVRVLIQENIEFSQYLSKWYAMVFIIIKDLKDISFTELKQAIINTVKLAKEKY